MMKYYVVRNNDQIEIIGACGFSPQGVLGEAPLMPDSSVCLDGSLISSRQVEGLFGELVDEFYVDSDKVAAKELSISLRLEESKWQILRDKRNILLRDTDYIMMPDYPMIDKSAYIVYRQALRDLPANVIDINNIIWPVKP